MRPDKQKIVDEVWDDARIAGFLDKAPMGDESSRDFSALLYAYRSMRPADFERFIVAFCAAGRDIDAPSNAGESLLVTIGPHRHSTAFREILVRHGARDG